MNPVFKRKANDQFSVERTTTCTLSVLIDSSYLLYTIVDNEKQLCEVFTKYALEEIISKPIEGTTDIANACSQIIEKDEYLRQEFHSSTLSLHNDEWTIVPRSLIQKPDIETYLRYNISESVDFSLYEKSINTLHKLGASVLFLMPYQIKNLFSLSHPKMVYKHHMTTLLELCYTSLHKSNLSTIYAHCTDDRLDIALFDDGELKLSNTYHCKTQSDFIYYILFIINESKLDRRFTSVFFTGYGVFTSAILDNVAKYVDKVSWIQFDDVLTATANQNVCPRDIKQKYYTLLYQHTCV